MNKKIFFYLMLFGTILLESGCSPNPEKKSGSDIGDSSYYSEKYRPQYHFSPEFGWMNDPNGMVYYDGEYHLFFQYYPDSTVWGPMHWGHAISTDLVHWDHLPIAIYPDSLGWIFSGSAVVDWNNTSGFGTENNPPLIAIFTIHDMEMEKAGGLEDETQGIAYSLDKGRTWTKYDRNPVVENPGIADFRDPKVIWHEPSQKWIMVLSAHDRVKIYSSKDLKDWQYESEFGDDAGSHGGVWECPDLFPLKVDETDQTKWVLLVNLNPGGPNGGSGTQYFVGDFDGHQFIAATKDTSWIDWGHDNYAGVTWSDIPGEDGRRIFLGWMSNWDYAQVVPTEKWRSAMTLPRRLELTQQSGGFLLQSAPVKELDLIIEHQSTNNFENLTVGSDLKLDVDKVNLNQSKLTVDFTFNKSTPDTFGISLANNLGEELRIGYSSTAQQLFVDRTQSGDLNFSNKFSGIANVPYEMGQDLQIELFIDAASVELFVDGGKVVMTEIFFNTKSYDVLKLFSSNNQPVNANASVSAIESIW